MQHHTDNQIVTQYSSEEIKAIADSLTNMMRSGALVPANTQAWQQSKDALAALYALSNA